MTAKTREASTQELDQVLAAILAEADADIEGGPIHSVVVKKAWTTLRRRGLKSSYADLEARLNRMLY